MRNKAHQQRVRPIFVSSERDHSYKGSGDYRYHIWYNGSLEIPSVTADVRFSPAQPQWLS